MQRLHPGILYLDCFHCGMMNPRERALYQVRKGAETVMGCDIHGNLERRPYKNDLNYWDDVQTIPNDRSYHTFSILANVRNYLERGLVTPISEPKGLPENVSF